MLDRIGAFEVFGSVWFSAIYLLLFTSLIGCITPRLRDHIAGAAVPPPAAPKRLERLPQHTVLPAPARRARRRSPRCCAGGAGGWRSRGDEVSAEKGYLKETGNLLFHISLIARADRRRARLVVRLERQPAAGGRRGQRVLQHPAAVRRGEARPPGRQRRPAAASACGWTTSRPGSWTSGQPEFFNATVTVDGPDEPTRSADFSVNSPLRLDGANVYLLGHGYAPVIRYTDRFGNSQTSDAPFLTTGDMGLTSEGLAAFPDATSTRPPASAHRTRRWRSPASTCRPRRSRRRSSARQYPTERNPALNLVAYRGNLGLDAGIPSSVYQLDQRQVRTGKVRRSAPSCSARARPGSWTTAPRSSSWAPSRTSPSPSGTTPARRSLLISCGVLLVGLMGSLFGRRRRVFFRVVPADPGGRISDGR